METLPETPVDAAAAITAEVLELLRPRIDALLEARIREALAPQVLRLAEDSTRHIRDELGGEVRALVAKAVVEALARRRER